MSARTIGRKHWTLAGAVVLAGFAAAAFLPGRAAAASPPSPADVLAGAQAEVQTQVDAAMAQTTQAVGQAQQLASQPQVVATPPPSVAPQTATSHSASPRARSARARAPTLPQPFGPGFPGSSDAGAFAPGGQGSGSGAAFPLLVAILGGVAALGIPFLLRKVFWSDLRVPRPVAPTPWRPG